MEASRLREQALRIQRGGGSYQVANGLRDHAGALHRASMGGMTREQTSEVVRAARRFWDDNQDEIQRYPIRL